MDVTQIGLSADDLIFGADLEDEEDAELLYDVIEAGCLASDSKEEISLSRPGDLNRSPKKNWVENAGGLPKYIEDIAKALHQDRGMTISRAIATAVNRVKKWASGVGDVNPDTRAKAAKALAEWTALKAKNKVRKAAK